MDYKTGLNITTFEAKVLIGRNVGYTSEKIDVSDFKNAIKKAVKRVDGYTFSGTITETTILASGVGKDYEEQGYELYTSIYPRFPIEVKEFKEKFTKFISELALILKQQRVCVRFSDETFMIETKYCENPDLK